MPQIHLRVTDGKLIAESAPAIVSQNEGYTLLVDLPAATTAASVTFTIEQDGTNTTVTEQLTGELELPAFPTAYGAHFRVHIDPDRGAEYDTDELWLPISNSIKGQPTRAYSAPYDAYNAIIRYINSDDPEERAALLAGLHYHAEHPAPYPGIAYDRAITATMRSTRLTGTLTPDGGAERQLTDADIKGSTLSISTSAVNSDYLLPGGVPSAKLDMTLYTREEPESLHNAEVAPTFGIMLETGRWFDVPLGVFTVTNEAEGSAQGVQLTAYDDMHRLDRIRTADLGFTDLTDYSPDQIISTICEAGGIDYASSVDHDARFIGAEVHSYVCVLIGWEDDPLMQEYATVIRNADDMTPAEIQAALDELFIGMVTYRGDYDYPNQLPKPGTGVQIFDAFRVGYDGPLYVAAWAAESAETARDLLMHTLFTVNAIGQINADRQLVLTPITPLDSTSDARLIDENQTTTRRVSRHPYQLQGLATVIDYYPRLNIKRSTKWYGATTLISDGGVNAEATTNALYPTTGNADEPLLEIQTALTRLVGLLDPVEFYPTRLTMRGDPTINLMDWIRTDDERATPVTNKVWRYRGSQILESCGEEAVAGAIRSQMEKQVIGDKLEISASFDETMRLAQLELMQTYAGLASFRYFDVENYTYSELGGNGT